MDEVDRGPSKEQKFIFMRGLFATSIGTPVPVEMTIMNGRVKHGARE